MTRAHPSPAVLSPSLAAVDLVREHGPTVWALCRRLSPDPEDAYQDVWEKIIARREGYDSARGSVRTWVLTVAHRRLVDRHRRRRVRGPVMPFTDAVAPGAPVDALLDQKRGRARLEAALAELPDAQRRAVVSHHIHGLELHHIADSEGVAVGTIKSRLHRGRAALAARLEASDDR